MSACKILARQLLSAFDEIVKRLRSYSSTSCIFTLGKPLANIAGAKADAARTNFDLPRVYPQGAAGTGPTSWRSIPTGVGEPRGNRRAGSDAGVYPHGDPFFGWGCPLAVLAAGTVAR